MAEDYVCQFDKFKLINQFLKIPYCEFEIKIMNITILI